MINPIKAAQIEDDLDRALDIIAEYVRYSNTIVGSGTTEVIRGGRHEIPMRFLAKHGRFEVTKDEGRMIVGRFVNKEKET